MSNYLYGAVIVDKFKECIIMYLCECMLISLTISHHYVVILVVKDRKINKPSNPLKVLIHDYSKHSPHSQIPLRNT